MTYYHNNKKYLQALSKRQLEAAERQRMAREVYYPEAFDEPEVWYTVTVESFTGEKVTMKLLNREGKRRDSYHIEVNGSQVYWNKAGKLVINATRLPLVIGISDAFRFLAKHFPRISGKHDE